MYSDYVVAVDSASPPGDGLRQVKALFAEPPKGYGTGPLWVWNDELSEEKVLSTLRDLASQGIRQAFVHPRPGLMTPYLSAEWFRLWKAALKEAERLDMKLWIYDENSYPSGFAGGFVPEAMPQSRGQSLLVREQNDLPELSNEIIGIYRLDANGFENVTEEVKSGTKMREGRYLIASAKLSPAAPWFGGKWYVDLLKTGVTDKFLEVTMEAYRREFGREFGRRIPGVFADEPHLGPDWDNHWTADLPQAFEKRWGYSLLDNLSSLFRPVGDWKRLRHNYHQVLLEMFIERWGKPYYDYCQNKGLELTGHYWEHEWPRCNMVPDNMAMYPWQQRPGIDCLFNQYEEGVHSQFGNVRSVLELSSVANQLGRRRTLCEAYGGSGWDMRFEDAKRIGDWLFVLGVNTLNEHLSHISIRGARKTDYPPSFSYHQPWWEAYHVLAGYFTRLSAAISQGRQINEILVIEPTTTAWMYQPDPNHKGHLEKIGEQFQQMVTALAKAQVEFDVGCEDIIAREGTVEGTRLKVGQRKYATVVLTPLTENLNAKTMKLLEAYAKSGGVVFCCGSAPAYVDGTASQRGKKLSENPGYKQVEVTALAATLLERMNDGFAIRAEEGDKGILLHHRRRLDDGELVFITNTNINTQCKGTIESLARSIERWDPETGLIDSYTFEKAGDGLSAKFELAPCGSLLLFLSKNPGKIDLPASVASRAIPAVGTVKVRRLESNVLTLDYMDVTAGGETKEHIYFYQACQFAFRKNGMDGNPWDGAVQFRDEIITKKFVPQSGVEATYRFTIEEKAPSPLFIAIERPDLYSITCNEKPVLANEGSWWLDRSFSKIDITSTAKVGENKVTIKASPFTVYHELAAAYVLGDFSLKAIDKGFTLVPDVALGLGKWNEQGYPFYSAAVSYNQTFDIPEPNDKYYVRLAGWYGSVAKVVANGASAGYIWHQPWECDVTERIRQGNNEIEVIVTGTLKNTLGPHHAKSPPGLADPKSFRKAPPSGPPAGSEYDTIGYGLFEPFELHRR
jgi:hypothetical protein